MESIYGIGYDFYQKNGHYLVLHEKQGEQLSENVLIPLQMRMMESNQIPNLLPLSIEELDFKIRLYYDITSKRNLNTYLKFHSLTSFEFYQLFINIITTLEQSKLYMLNEYHYILKEEFIFVGKEAKQLYLMYLPIDSFEKETTTLEELKTLLIRVVNRVESLQGSEQKHITQYVKDSAFSLKGLKEMLLDLQRLRPAPYNGFQPQQYQQPMNHVVTPNPVDPFQGNQQNLPINGYQPQQMQATENMEKPVKTEKTSTSKKKKKENTKDKKSENTKIKKNGAAFTQRQKVYIVLIALLVLTIIWKIYEAIPNKTMLYTSGALSILVLITVIFLFLKRSKDPLAAIVEVAAANQQTEAPVHSGNMPWGYGSGYQSAPLQSSPYGGKQNHYYSGNGTSQQGNSGQIMQQSQEMQISTNIQTNIPQSQDTPNNIAKNAFNPFHEQQSSFSLDTNLLVENDDTVLLEDEEEADISLQPKKEPYLEVERDGENEKIALSENSFTIGRNETAVHYVEDSVGISRVHLEFIKIDTSCGVKDLGSKNGTKLNGEALVPYKIYALNEEDIISIGKVNYRFLWE